MRASKRTTSPGPLSPLPADSTDLNDWVSCLLIGVGRCRTVQRLNLIYRGWEAEINAHERREEILAAMKTRKEMLNES
jgi:hypothetical protein